MHLHIHGHTYTPLFANATGGLVAFWRVLTNFAEKSTGQTAHISHMNVNVHDCVRNCMVICNGRTSHIILTFTVY